MKMKYLFTTLTLFLSIATAMAQEVRGRVVDQNNEPLIGATILWEGTTVGTLSEIGRAHV